MRRRFFLFVFFYRHNLEKRKMRSEQQQQQQLYIYTYNQIIMCLRSAIECQYVMQPPINSIHIFRGDYSLFVDFNASVHHHGTNVKPFAF